MIVPLLFLLVWSTRSQETQQTSGRSLKTGEKSVRRNNERVIVCGLHLQHHSLFGSCLVVASCAPVDTLIYNKGGDMDSVSHAFGCYFSRWPQQIISLHLILSLASSVTSSFCMSSFYSHESSLESPSFPPTCQFHNHLPFPIYPRFILYSSKNNLSLIDLVSRLPNLMSLWCHHFWIQGHIFRL